MVAKGKRMCRDLHAHKVTLYFLVEPISPHSEKEECKQESGL